MKELTLNNKELLYIGALTGTDNLWGVENPFEDMDEEELRSELLALQGTLVTRGYFEAEPDSGFRLSADAVKCMELCRGSGTVYELTSSAMERAKSRLRYFDSEEGTLRCSLQEEEVRISYIPCSMLQTEITAFFGDVGSAEITGSLVAGAARLRRMGSLSRSHFLEELRRSGCDPELALLIADALQGEADFCSLMKFDRSGTDFRLSGKLVTLRFSGGSLMVTPGGDDPEMVCFTRLDREHLAAELRRLLRCGEEVL